MGFEDQGKWTRVGYHFEIFAFALLTDLRLPGASVFRILIN